MLEKHQPCLHSSQYRKNCPNHWWQALVNWNLRIVAGSCRRLQDLWATLACWGSTANWKIHPVWRWRDTLCSPSNCNATLTRSFAYLWVIAEICCGNASAIPHRILGSEAETHLWPFVTTFKKSWYLIIWATFQKGLSHRPFACWLWGYTVSKGLILEKWDTKRCFYQSRLRKLNILEHQNAKRCFWRSSVREN